MTGTTMAYQHTPSTIGRASRHQTVAALQALQRATLQGLQCDIAYDPLDRMFTAWIKYPEHRYITASGIGRTPETAAQNLQAAYPEYFQPT